MLLAVLEGVFLLDSYFMLGSTAKTLARRGKNRGLRAFATFGAAPPVRPFLSGSASPLLSFFILQDTFAMLITRVSHFVSIAHLPCPRLSTVR